MDPLSSMVLTVLAVCISRAHALFGETVGNEETVGFIQGDNQRDTISLLISCLATLGLCIYSAIHLNLPGRRTSFAGIIWRDFRWCMLGLFAPELALYTAWRQLASARQLCDEVRRAMASEEGEAREKDRNATKKIESVTETEVSVRRGRNQSWTIAHGFYATMGGIAVDIDDDDSKYAPVFGDAKRLTFTAKGVALLAHCGVLPDVSVDDIKDKNKTDALAKFLVCVQAGWMIIQVLYRRALDLPTTLLEVNTVAHVACALLMYAIWWHKPRQVESPTVLKGEELWPLVAYMYSASRISGKRIPGAWGRLTNPTSEMKQMYYAEEKLENATRGDGISSQFCEQKSIRTGLNGRFVHRNPSAAAQDTESSTLESGATILRRELAAQAVTTYPILRSRFRSCVPDHSASSDIERFIPYHTELVQLYSVDWPNAGLLRRTQSLVMGMVLWGASMAYGAIHVSAWRYFFPTQTEKLLWQLSSVWATFCAAFWLVLCVIAHFFSFVDRIWVAYNERRLGWFVTSIITALCVLCGLSYIGSRAYLVVEAFVSLRVVPKGVYETPSWSQVFPHL